MTPPFDGLIHRLGENWTTIGRGDQNMFQIDDGSISTCHCEVRVLGRELLIRDLNSTNGTFLGGFRITEGTARIGQTLRLGNIEVRLDIAQSAIPKVAVVGSDAPIPRAVMVLPAKAEETGAHRGPQLHVLFVDDSMAFLDSFPTLCGELSCGRWQIYTASAPDSALTMLEERPMDLVILDINMPTLDGIQLLGLIRRRYPHLKVAVMTGFANESNRAAALANGAELFLEKPSASGDIRMTFKMLDDVLTWAGQKEGFSGALLHIGLPDVIQLECLNRKSLILEIRNQQSQGQIHIEAGEITHAAAGSLIGEQAFYQLLLLKGGNFQVKPFIPPEKRTIHGHWEMLLMDAARASDEESAPSR